MKNYFLTAYPDYFQLTICQRINARQHRNSLNINHLFPTTIRQMGIKDKREISFPKINNGLYHHIGKTHSKYPKK